MGYLCWLSLLYYSTWLSFGILPTYLRFLGFMLSFLPTQLGRSTHFNWTTTVGSSNRLMVSLNRLKVFEGKKCHVLKQNALVEDRWTWIETQNSMAFKILIMNFNPFNILISCSHCLMLNKTGFINQHRNSISTITSFMFFKPISTKRIVTHASKGLVRSAMIIFSLQNTQQSRREIQVFKLRWIIWPYSELQIDRQIFEIKSKKRGGACNVERRSELILFRNETNTRDAIHEVK